MGSNEQTTESTVKSQIAAKVDPAIAEVIDSLAREDERSNSNTIERLLRSHPVVMERLQSVQAS